MFLFDLYIIIEVCLYKSGKFHLILYCGVYTIRRLGLDVFSHLLWINVLV